MKIFKVIVVAVCLLYINQGYAVENSPEALKSQMKEMISTLNSNSASEIKNFVKKYAVSSELSSALNFSQMNELVKTFTSKKMDTLIGLLDQAKDTDPTIDKDQRTYHFNELGLKFKYSGKTKQFHLVNECNPT